jgi:hypothetical protein
MPADHTLQWAMSRWWGQSNTLPVFNARGICDGSDCFQACIASVLELPLDEVPRRTGLQSPDDYVDAIRGWLRPRGFSLMVFSLPAPTAIGAIHPFRLPEGYWIAGIDTAGALEDHAIVMHGPDLAWDPLPRPHAFEERVATPRITAIAAFVPLDPAG